MKSRWIIFGLIAALLALLFVLGAQLPKDLRALSTANSDNARWTVLQADTEFANLNAILIEESLTGTPDSAKVRLRTDIALSRTSLILEGRARSLLGNSSNVTELLTSIAAYHDDVIKIVDQTADLNADDIAALKDLTIKVRPAIRQLALVGLSQETARADLQREEFADKLRRIGLVAIALLTFLALALVYLDQLFKRARQKDRELRTSAERLRATVAASLDGIVISNAKGEIIDFNDAATEIFGWPRDEIIGRQMGDTIVPHQHRDSHAAGMTRYLTTREAHVVDAGRIELTALRKTGEEFPIELNITSTEGDSGEIFIAYVRDISERKVSEQKLVDARDLAERTDRAKSNFLTVMSHEMRTPLNGILGVLDLLKTTDLDPRQSRHVQVAAASGEILLEHVNEALDITRIETGVMSLTPEVFSLETTVRRVTDVLRTLAQEKNLTLKVDYDPTMKRSFFADGVRVNQILTNLIGNAIKFTDEGEITVHVTGIHGPHNTEATITVTDTGTGIPQEKLETVFEDFVALAQSKGRQRRGDGLGLSISRKVARLMKGDLNVQSELGEGSSFILTIPLERAEAVTQEQTTPPDNIEPTKRSILIVEDNAINRSVLKEMLIGFGNKVTEAVNGLEGVNQAETTKFDLIIMDISMPIMDGIEATQRIREGQGANAETYILGLTAHGRQEYRTTAQNAGMDGFCTKPVRLSELRATLDGIAAPEMESDPEDGLSTDVLEDLHGVLGAEMLQSTADQFFDELKTALTDLRKHTPEKDAQTISEILHQQRGASMMMGLGALADEIDKTSEANKSGQSDAYLTGVDGIERAGTLMSGAFSSWLAKTKG